jgi:S1/P1 Nuclease
MKKLVLLLFSCLLMVESFGWGATGHRATGLIAEQYLNAKARKRIKQILGQESLAMVSTWMDEIRSDSSYNYTTDWHWTTIPDGGKYEDVETNPDGKVVMMIEKFTKELKAGKLTTKQQAEYLKMLVHMVGDIHQPLHVGKPGDRGGNDVKVKWAGGDSNLHRVWDTDMIDDTKLSYTELTQSLGKPSAETVKKWQQASVRDWAKESMTLRPALYSIGKGSLGYRYSYVNLPSVRERLLQAGVRIAGLLNQIYGK